MIRRKVSITLHDSKNNWIEDYLEDKHFDKQNTDLEGWAKEMVDSFNSSLRPYDEERFIDKISVSNEEVEDNNDNDEDCDYCDFENGEHDDTCPNYEEDGDEDSDEDIEGSDEDEDK